MSKLKLYRHTNTLPFWRWNELNKSISNGQPELRWLMKFDIDDGFPEIEDQTELIEAYNQIISQIMSIDISIQRSWVEFLFKNAKLRLNRAKNRRARALSEPEIKIKYDPAEMSLSEYLMQFERKYDNFKVDLFTFRQDYKEFWAKTFESPVPSEVKKLEDIKFHSLAQYTALISDYRLKDFLSKSMFLNNFFDHQYVIMSSLTELNGFLRNALSDHIDLWLEYRETEFHYTNIIADFKYDSSAIKDIMELNRALGTNYDTKKITVAEYEQAVKLLQEENKRAKKHVSI